MGVSGRIARAFLTSKLTPLITLASLIVGGIALVATPREEEPQISVPMIDVMVALPGAGPEEMENLVTRPIEKLMWEIPSVEYVYATAGEGYSLVTVRFLVGENQEVSVTKVQAKLYEAASRLPAGASAPAIRPYTIDDVPILTATLSSEHYGSNELRRMVILLEDEVRALPDVAATFVVGGTPRQIRVDLDPARMAASGATAAEVVQALQRANLRLVVGEVIGGNRSAEVAVEGRLSTVAEVAQVVVETRSGVPILLSQVADVEDRFGSVDSYVLHDEGRGAVQAVTLAVAKRPGANATDVSRSILRRIEEARPRLLPPNVAIGITRNYGETAREKANELILHLFLATLSVTVLIGLFLGWREALVVLVAVPVTLGLTLFVYYALGYTLNRITLFALIFSIGILVDDAIVVVENIYRHLKMRQHAPEAASVEAVDEVGNPTILATATVIAAILPMAFVSGLMGPYMRPIPIGASAAMLASLGVAFIVTPYLALKLLRGHTPIVAPHAPGARSPELSSRFGRAYAALLAPLLGRAKARIAVYAGTVVLLLLAVGLLLIRVVEVKMLPFDNKSDFQVILDMPEGTTLEQTTRVAQEMADYVLTVPEVRNAQVYAGVPAPFNFNGLVRHYFLRRGPTVADLQVNLAPKHERRRQSHAIAVSMRPRLEALAREAGGRVKIAEVPPGPPVLSTLVVEVYGRDDSTRFEAAQRVLAVLEATPGVVDVDWTIDDPEARWILQLDRTSIARAGADVQSVVQTAAIAVSGASAGRLDHAVSRTAVEITPRLSRTDRQTLEGLLALPVPTATGPTPLGRFVRLDSTTRPSARFRKNLRPVIYLTADVAGTIESPVYAILEMNRALDTMLVDGAPIARYNAIQPERLDETAIKWDGEWQITLEVFRDLGIAFAIVLILIYVLVVGWFQSFTVPLVIMAPIPLTLIGILPGHAATGAFFTATSMIGMIALAGIIVRNSILLVDFIQLSEARGRTLEEAVLEAGAVRFRPIALTAAAVVVGGLVMVLDPIFQGLAVALISGALVATALTMIIVPVLYYEIAHPRERG